MGQTIRAIYVDGQLKPLEPVELAEGQEVHLTILSERERARAALGELLGEAPAPAIEHLDDEALFRELDKLPNEGTSLSEIIIEERREGP
jgi:predicted DNA-binding antitoxin AbrB/MazE fold protein